MIHGLESWPHTDRTMCFSAREAECEGKDPVKLAEAPPPRPPPRTPTPSVPHPNSN